MDQLKTVTLTEITLSANAINKALTELINEFFRIENKLNSKDSKQLIFISGKIDLLATIIQEKKDIKLSFREYLCYLADKYNLEGVSITDRQDSEQG